METSLYTLLGSPFAGYTSLFVYIETKPRAQNRQLRRLAQHVRILSGTPDNLSIRPWLQAASPSYVTRERLVER